MTEAPKVRTPSSGYSPTPRSPYSAVSTSPSGVCAGIHVERMTGQLRDFFGVFSNFGVLVTAIDRSSAAERAGLKAGDVIITIDGKNIHTPADLTRELRAGSTSTLKIIRDRQESEIKLQQDGSHF